MQIVYYLSGLGIAYYTFIQKFNATSIHEIVIEAKAYFRQNMSNSIKFKFKHWILNLKEFECYGYKKSKQSNMARQYTTQYNHNVPAVLALPYWVVL